MLVASTPDRQTKGGENGTSGEGSAAPPIIPSVLMSMSFRSPGTSKSLVRRPPAEAGEGGWVADRRNRIRDQEESGNPSATFKVFVLLLNCPLKIFELIQVVYDPSLATVGDVMDLIPPSATEPMLGRQSHVGFVRPSDVDGLDALVDLSVMASGVHERTTAKIHRGEILVAIPVAHSAAKAARAAGPILKNPKVTRLLGRADPLSPEIYDESASRAKDRKGRSGGKRRGEKGRRSSRKADAAAASALRERAELQTGEDEMSI